MYSPRLSVCLSVGCISYETSKFTADSQLVFAEGPETEVSCSPVELTHVRGHLKCLYVLAYVKACSQHINRSELNTV